MAGRYEGRMPHTQRRSIQNIRRDNRARRKPPRSGDSRTGGKAPVSVTREVIHNEGSPRRARGFLVKHFSGSRREWQSTLSLRAPHSSEPQGHSDRMRCRCLILLNMYNLTPMPIFVSFGEPSRTRTRYKMRS